MQATFPRVTEAIITIILITSMGITIVRGDFNIICFAIIGSLRCTYGDGNENIKKQLVKISKTTTLHVHHAFLYISLPSLHDYDVNCLISRFIDT